ncbi:oxidoreductase, putative [Cryptococcus deneoformans JEC21]|uniref:Oxidoreductase, putative n=1 Tax=Cryptococcus deneoformans (strain JEC21 / ATCC MYA-565) TaxID=214684 RepID=Q5KLD5_CRYD1|nr:oxidoreductase, putative [Cryptococcus neoformans var. neoformans JEC21]AAW42001.2 oxidoreductase, putative [Cryptococcus neoformans var. neoformans JEC21]
MYKDLHIAPRSTIISNTMSFSSPSSLYSSVYFSSPPSSPPSTPPLTSPYPSYANKPKVLLIGDYCGHETFDKQIREIAEVHTLPTVTYDETVELIKQKVEQVGGGFVAFGGLFTSMDTFPDRWDATLLSPLLPSCKLFVGPGAGYDKVDVPWLTSVGAMYANAPTIVGKRTAEGALVLTLAAMRGVVRYDMSVRKGVWGDRGVRTVDWKTAKIGIIGLGSIGSHLAFLLSSIGATSIFYHSRRPSLHAASNPAWTYLPNRDDLYAQSDVIILACPLTKETEGMIGRAAFGKMKDGVILVNVSRGKVVKEEELVEALESGKVMRAALDVFENEPTVHPNLLTNPNVILSPHVAPAPDSMGPYIKGEVIENIIHYLQTGMPLTPINLPQLKAEGWEVDGKEFV